MIWFSRTKTLRIYMKERERERERVRISSGVEKLRWPVGLPLNFPLPIFQSWSTERRERERERESLCLCRNWLCLWFWALDFLFYLRLLDIYYCTCLAAVFRFLAPVPLAIDSWYTPKIYNVYLGFSNLGHNHILLSPPSNLISLFSCTIN